MRVAVLAAAVGCLATAAAATESLELTGYAGVLGEWELTANVTATSSDAGEGIRRAGEDAPRRLLHPGRTGGKDRRNPRSPVGASSSRMTATLLVNGVECSYSGRQSDSYTGSLKCPDRRAVPLTVWLK